MSSNAMQVYDSSSPISLWRSPEEVLGEAKQAADALTKVISLKKNPVKFNNEIYLEFEDWQNLRKVLRRHGQGREDQLCRIWKRSRIRGRRCSLRP